MKNLTAILVLWIAIVFLICAGGTAGAQPACTYSVSPSSLDFDLRGGTAEIRVTASEPTCTFNARSAYPWITISVSQERGGGLIKVSISGNSSMTHRVGAIMIDGREVTITQYGPRITGGG